MLNKFLYIRYSKKMSIPKMTAFTLNKSEIRSLYRPNEDIIIRRHLDDGKNGKPGTILFMLWNIEDYCDFRRQTDIRVTDHEIKLDDYQHKLSLDYEYKTDDLTEMNTVIQWFNANINTAVMYACQ